MKKLILGIVLCVVLMLGGCGEMLTPGDVQSLASQQTVLQQQLDAIQVAAAGMTDGLAAGGIVDQNTVARLAKINEEADRVQAQINVIAQALSGVLLSGDTTQDLIAQLQAANAASSGFNPYAIPVGAGLSILSLVLGWLARRNAKKYKAHKQGVAKTMKEVSASSELKEVEAQLYNNIGEARVLNGL